MRGPGEPTLTRAQLATLGKIAAAARAESTRSAGPAIAVFTGLDAHARAAAVGELASGIGRAVHRIDLSRVVSTFIGETEKNLARVFAKADAAVVVLFFDEADSLFGRRSEVKDAHDRYANLEVGYLLGRLEGFAGVVVVATNAPAATLHPSLVRRARWSVDFSEG